MAKVTMITLVVPEHGMMRDFVVEHAERLLAMKNNGGWELPADSPYKYEDGSISKRDKKEGKGK
jgi:hypothetical protein